MHATRRLLAEIAVLAKVSSVRLKLISANVIASLTGGELDVNKLRKHVSDTALGESDVHALVAAIDYIVRGAVRHQVGSELLSSELQQLGLPRENSDALVRPYNEHRDELTQRASDTTIALPRVLSCEARADCIVSSSSESATITPAAQLTLRLGDNTSLRFELDRSKVGVLLAELKLAKEQLDKVS